MKRVVVIDNKKICGKCNKLLSLDKFNKHKYNPTGYEPQCRECKRQYRVKNYEWDKERSKIYYRNHKEETRKRQKLYRQTHPDKHYFAHNESQKLKKMPCVICGFYPTEKHHYDYKKAKDVIYLCIRHHRQLHKDCLEVYNKLS